MLRISRRLASIALPGPLAVAAFALALALALAPGPRPATAQAVPAARPTGPWDLPALRATPAAAWGQRTGPVREVYYEGARRDGRPTRVFGYYARPATGDGPFPAMLLVHGGGGKAFARWARLWADRGYVALAMDTAGRGPDGARLPDGGPDQDDETKFRDLGDGEADRAWTYHAVAAVVRGHSLLAGREEVDPGRIGVTGISWGGYLTCLVAAVDDRVKVAVPVYGCGFLQDDSYWRPRFEAMGPERRRRWVGRFDPSSYLGNVSCPILFVNGTNDFAYPLDSYRKTYEAVPGFTDLANPDRLCVTLRMPHGHEQGWAPAEIGRFVDSVLIGGEPLAKLAPPTVTAGHVRSEVVAKSPLARAELLYAVDAGPWPAREWKAAPAALVGGAVEADLPAVRPLVVFLNVVDRQGAVSSSPHALVPATR